MLYCFNLISSFPNRYSEKCNGKKTPECSANKWILENVPNGEFLIKIGVRHNTAAFTLDLQVNGKSVFANRMVKQIG